jgi:hypothetical protein
LSARRTASPAMMTGLIIGKLIAMGSIFVMFTSGWAPAQPGRILVG